MNRSSTILCGAVFLTALSFVAASAPTLEDCERRVEQEPYNGSAYLCFVQSVHAYGRWDEAVEKLEAYLVLRPEVVRVHQFLGMLEEKRSPAVAEKHFRKAAEGSRRLGDPYAETYARLSLAFLIGRQGRLDEAETELEQAERAAQSTDDQVLLAHAWVGQAVQANRRMDYGRAQRLHKRAEQVAFDNDVEYLKPDILSGLGVVAWALGDYRQAITYFEREAELYRQAGNVFTEASPRYNIALMAARLWDRGEITTEEYRQLKARALDAAVRGGNRRLETSSRLMLGQGWRGDLAIAEFEQALTIAREVSDFDSRLFATRLIANELFRRGQPEDRDRAWALLRQAIGEAREIGNRFHIARGLILRGNFLWDMGQRDEAIEAALQAFAAVERIRDLQPEGSVRARTFAQWVYPYYRLSGYLLQSLDEATSPGEDLALAFATMERMRCRVLLDQLDAAGASQFDRSHPLHASRSVALAEITRVQKDLLDPSLGDEARTAKLIELDHLEVEEAGLRDRLAREDSTFARLRSPVIPSLDEIRSALAPDQALLAFQVFRQERMEWGVLPDQAGSWVVAITADKVEAFSIPYKDVLKRQVTILRGLFASRDGAEELAATRLYSGILQQAIASLPESIERLILVPDSILYRLPFAALRSKAGADPLGLRYELSFVPSATMWMRWKDDEIATATNTAALAFADPETPFHTADSGPRRGSPWRTGLHLAALPLAHKEALDLTRRMGRGSRVLEGPEASEAFLKSAELSDYRIIHFAAHALFDDSHPERSAIMLAPGGTEEDGLLQMREIVEFDLEDHLVILSACSSGSGELVDGEGVMGLARAFFQAGARAVVASLWPLRDDEAALVVDEFSRELSRGSGVAASLTAAQRSLAQRGLPAAAWGGLVVLGDGDLTPFARARVPSRGAVALVVILVVVVLLVGLRFFVFSVR